MVPRGVIVLRNGDSQWFAMPPGWASPYPQFLPIKRRAWRGIEPHPFERSDVGQWWILGD